MPNFSMEEIKHLFVSAVNQLIEQKDSIIAQFTAVMATALSTSALEVARDELQEEMMVVSDLVQNCINENAHVALDQAEYQKRYDSLTARFDSVKERLEAVMTEISDKHTRQATIVSFLTALQAQKTFVEKFESSLWYGLLDFVTVYAKDDVRFTFKNGTEIRA